MLRAVKGRPWAPACLACPQAFGRPPAFQPNPDNALPYTSLAYEGGRLVFRPQPAAEDALGVAAAAAVGEGPLPGSAARGYALEQEAAAAVGAEEDGVS